MKRFLCMILCLVALLCLAACSQEKEAAEEGCTKYKLKSMGMGQMIMSAQEAREASGIQDLYLKLYDDGTAVLRVGKEPLEMCYDATHLWLPDAPQEKIPYTIEGDTLTFVDGAMAYTFEK